MADNEDRGERLQIMLSEEWPARVRAAARKNNQRTSSRIARYF